MNVLKTMLVGVAITAASMSAQAVTVVSTASFLEDTLGITGNNGATAVATERSFTVDTYTPFKEGFKIGSTNSIGSELEDTYANGRAFANSTFFDSSPEQWTQTTAETAGFGGAFSMREWDIQIQGAGDLTVDVEYLFSADILHNTGEADGDGFASGSVEIYFEGEKISASDDFYITDKDSVGDEEFLSFFPTLSISKSVIDGENISLVMITNTFAESGVAPVPVPAAF